MGPRPPWERENEKLSVRSGRGRPRSQGNQSGRIDGFMDRWDRVRLGKGKTKNGLSGAAGGGRGPRGINPDGLMVLWIDGTAAALGRHSEKASKPVCPERTRAAAVPGETVFSPPSDALVTWRQGLSLPEFQLSPCAIILTAPARRAYLPWMFRVRSNFSLPLTGNWVGSFRYGQDCLAEARR